MPPPPPEEISAGVWTAEGPPPGERAGKKAIGFGIAGLIIGPLAIVALVMASRGQREADEAGVESPSSVGTGRVLGWVGVGLWALGIIITFGSAVTG